MTVVHTDVADKAVSTEDATDMVHLDAVLSALVESKVEAMKATTSSVSTGPSTDGWGSGNINLGHLKLTPMFSSQTRHRNDVLQQHHTNEAGVHRMGIIQHHRHRNRRYGTSAPHEKEIGELNTHFRPYCHRHRRVSELTRSPEYNRRFLHSSQISPDDSDVGSSTQMELCGLDQFSTLMNIGKSVGACSDSGEHPGLHRIVCSPQNVGHWKSGDEAGDDNFTTLDIEDKLEIGSLDHSDSTMNDSQNGNHQCRKKRKKRRKHVPNNILMTRIPEVMMVDHDELPPRARWTIVVTACLLLAMSILLVGVTLRMAPIIDDMVRKENEVLLDSLGQNAKVPMTNATMSP